MSTVETEMKMSATELFVRHILDTSYDTTHTHFHSYRILQEN